MDHLAVGDHFGGGYKMEILFLIAVSSAVLWLAFGNKKDWSGI